MDFGRHETNPYLVDHLLNICSADAVPLHDEMNDRIRQHVFKLGFGVRILLKLDSLCRLFRVCKAARQGKHSF